MSTQTRQALLDSIEKWRRNEAVNNLEEAKIRGDDCPLCRLFVLATKTCDGCPVYALSGYDMCEDTPYLEAHDAYYTGNISAFRDHAKRERIFLESALAFHDFLQD